MNIRYPIYEGVYRILTFVLYLSGFFCFITRQCIRWYMAMTHCLPVCMNTLHTILHQCNTGCRWALPYKVHCIHAIWGSMYPILHCTDAMYSVMQDCRAAYMALHIYG